MGDRSLGDFVFSLGMVPVQEWIAEARRSRDLRAGSVLLWKLMVGLLADLEEAGATVLLPRPAKSFSALDALSFGQALAEPYGIPNRATGVFRGGEEERVRAALATLPERLDDRWRRWVESSLSADGSSAETRELLHHLESGFAAERRRLGPTLGNPFQVLWVAQRLEVGALEGPQAVAAAIQTIERLFGEVKHSRTIRLSPPGAPIGKCTQCGHREALGPRGGEGASGRAVFGAWRDGGRELDRLPSVQRGRRIEAGERLCFVCFAKRLAGYARGADERLSSFPSTGLVASAPWRKRIPADLHPAFQELVRAADAVGDDLGRALYASDTELRSGGLSAVQEARNRLRRALRERRGGGGDAQPLPAEPSPYLALLALDGDDMGRAVSRRPEEVSERMRRFAAAAEERIRADDGAAFYLGGDEALAMLPAARALPVARDLSERFAEIFAADGLTLSAGLVFFEQRQPLGRALAEARCLLVRAKALPGKSALGMAVETASGTRWELVDRWGVTWDRVVEATDMVRGGELSAAWAYDVESFLDTLDEETWRSLCGGPEPLRAEVERLLLRRMQGKWRSKEARRRAHAELWRRLAGDQLWLARGHVLVERDAEQFHLIGFLARQLVVASREAEAAS